MPRILRVRQAGTGSGGTGNPRAVPGVMQSKDSAVGDKDSPGMLRAYAQFREKAANAIRRTPIGSKGRL